MRAIPAIFLLLAIGMAETVLATEPVGVIPTLPTRSLDGSAVRVPDDLAPGPVLLIVGFTRDSREQTRAWARRVADAADVVAYSVAVIKGVPGLLRGMVVRGMRKGVPEDAHARFLLADDEAAQWRALAGFSPQREDAACLLLLDAARRIAWRHVGPLDEPAWRALQAALPGAR